MTQMDVAQRSVPRNTLPTIDLGNIKDCWVRGVPFSQVYVEAELRCSQLDSAVVMCS